MFNNLYNINFNELKQYFNINYIFLFVILFFICFMILFTILTYIIYKILKQSLDDLNIFFYQYNKKCQKILNLYGDYKITNIYLVRRPLGKTVSFLLNIFTFFEFNKLIEKYPEIYPFHTEIIFDIKLKNGINKLILLDKSNCINICETFLITEYQEIKKIKLKSKKYTINSILNATKDRIGNEQFFNWHMHKNNCQEFIIQILKTLGNDTKTNKNFIYRNKILTKISDFTVHIGNCLCLFYNIIEKYIFDSSLIN